MTKTLRNALEETQQFIASLMDAKPDEVIDFLTNNGEKIEDLISAALAQDISETRLFKFDELSDKAKDKARDWWRSGVHLDDWSECTIEDAKIIGLRITGFDIDRNSYCDGDLMKGAAEVASAIVENHGAECETHKTAAAFLLELEKLAEQESKEQDDMNDYGAAREELEDEFSKALRQDYLQMLRREYEYQNSNEVVDENIRANGYTFDENGKRCG